MRCRLFVAFLCASVWFVGSTPADAFQVQATNPAFGKKAARWATQPVPIFLHQDGAPSIKDGSDIRALKSAFALWSAPACNNLKFAIKLTTITVFSGDRQDPDDPISPFQKDGKSVVRFESKKWNFGDSVIAKNSTFFKPDTGELQEADLLFNAVKFKWSTDETPGTIDVITVAMARIGQMIGLWISDDPNAVMGANFDLRRIDRTLRQDDINGSCFLYNVKGWTNPPPPPPREPGNIRPEPAPPPPTETPGNSETPGTPGDGGTGPVPDNTPPTDPGCGGCQANPGSAGFSGFLMAFVLLLLVVRRRTPVNARK